MSDPLDEVLQLKSQDEIMNDKGSYIFNRTSRKYEPRPPPSLNTSSRRNSEEIFFDSMEGTEQIPQISDKRNSTGTIQRTTEEITKFASDNEQFASRLKALNAPKDVLQETESDNKTKGKRRLEDPEINGREEAEEIELDV